MQRKGGQYTVRRGDTPATIAYAYTGDLGRYTELVAANSWKKRGSCCAECATTFNKLTAGEVLWLPESWNDGHAWIVRRGLSGTDPNGLPTSADIVDQSVNAVENSVLDALGIHGRAQGFANAITTGLVTVSLIEAAIPTVVAITATVASVASAGGVAIASTIYIPAIGEIVAIVVGVVVALTAIFSFFSGRWITIDSTVDGEKKLSFDEYMNKTVPSAVAWVKKYPVEALKLTPEQFGYQASILPYDRAFDADTRPVAVGTQGSTLLLGAYSILHILQLATAAGMAAATPCLMPLWRFTFPAAFPLLSNEDIQTIANRVQPDCDAYTVIVQRWVNAHSKRPSIDTVLAKFPFIVRAQAAPIVDAYVPALVVGGHPPIDLPTPVPPHPKTAQSAPLSVPTKVVVGTAAVAGAGAAGVGLYALYNGLTFAQSASHWYNRAKWVAQNVTKKRKR